MTIAINLVVDEEATSALAEKKAAEEAAAAEQKAAEEQAAAEQKAAEEAAAAEAAAQKKGRAGRREAQPNGLHYRLRLEIPFKWMPHHKEIQRYCYYDSRCGGFWLRTMRCM